MEKTLVSVEPRELSTNQLCQKLALYDNPLNAIEVRIVRRI